MKAPKLVLLLSAICFSPSAYSQSFEIVYTFPSQSAGWNPTSTPYIGTGGVLFGTTAFGGTVPCSLSSVGCGTVFSLSPPASPGGVWTQTTLYSFHGSDGAQPLSGVVPGSNGTLVGTAEIGGPPNSHCRAGCGTFFQLTSPAVPGGAWTEQVVYNFLKADFQPRAVVPGSNGVFFGAALFGGNMMCNLGCGSLYELLPPPQGGAVWALSRIHEFALSTGAVPNTPLAMGANGVLYGTAELGGNKNLQECPSGCGTVFSMTPPVPPATAWTFQDIYRFQSGNDGFIPQAGLVVGADGTLYGTTDVGGGTGCGGAGCGTVFALTPGPAGGLWTETILHSFAGGTDGSFPESESSNLVIGPGGVLYGVTTEGGGTGCFGQGCGIFYVLTPPAIPGGAWSETILHTFTGGADGQTPVSGPAINSAGVVYGFAGGGAGTSCGGGGCGVIYEYIP